MHTYTHSLPHIYTCTNTFIFTHIHTHIYSLTHTYTYTITFTYTFIFTLAHLLTAPTLSTSDTNGDAAAVTGPSILPTLDVSVSGEGKSRIHYITQYTLCTHFLSLYTITIYVLTHSIYAKSSIIHSLTHSLTRTFTHSLTLSLTHSLCHSLTYSHFQLSTFNSQLSTFNSLTHSLTRSHTRTHTHVHTHTHTHVHTLTHSLAHLLTSRTLSTTDADGDTGAPAGPGIDATPGIAADVDGTVGFIQLWLSISEFNVLYDPGTADDQLGVHTFAFVSAESFMKKRKEKAGRIAAGEEPAHVHVVMDETLSDNCEPFWENELTVTSDGKKVLSVTCDGSCCGDVDSKTYFPKCLMEMRPVESVDLEMVRFSTFFAQQHLDKDLSNALTRNLLY